MLCSYLFVFRWPLKVRSSYLVMQVRWASSSSLLVQVLPARSQSLRCTILMLMPIRTTSALAAHWETRRQREFERRAARPQDSPQVRGSEWEGSSQNNFSRMPIIFLITSARSSYILIREIPCKKLTTLIIF